MRSSALPSRGGPRPSTRRTYGDFQRSGVWRCHGKSHSTRRRCTDLVLRAAEFIELIRTTQRRPALSLRAWDAPCSNAPAVRRARRPRCRSRRARAGIARSCCRSNSSRCDFDISSRPFERLSCLTRWISCCRLISSSTALSRARTSKAPMICCLRSVGSASGTPPSLPAHQDPGIVENDAHSRGGRVGYAAASVQLAHVDGRASTLSSLWLCSYSRSTRARRHGLAAAWLDQPHAP